MAAALAAGAGHWGGDAVKRVQQAETAALQCNKTEINIVCRSFRKAHPPLGIPVLNALVR